MFYIYILMMYLAITTTYRILTLITNYLAITTTYLTYQ